MFLPSNITLKFGDSGDFVSELQRRLAMVKCFTDDQVNGFYDGPTVSAVTGFQGMNGLTADGVAGPETLRRLNGVIAGDTSGAPADEKKEEELTQSYEQQAQVYDYVQQQTDAAPWVAPAAEEVQHTPVEAAPVAYEPPPPPPAPEAAPAQPSALEMLMRAEQLQQQNPPPPAPSAPAADAGLAAFLPQAEPAPQPHAHAPHTHPAPVPPPVAVPQPAETPTIKPLFAAEPMAEQPAPVASTEEKPTQPGMLRRFANAVMQKMADYFEAKLPPSVLKEVQQIGLTMAQAGMKEAPVPTGPEMQQRPPELPGREQAQGQQRA